MRHIRSQVTSGLIVASLFLITIPSSSADDKLRKSALESLRRATMFFRNEVAVDGGYLWRYSADLKNREGEVAASESTVWIQPPGTPSIGMAFLKAFEATDDLFYRDAAIDVGRCLALGQLRSGGWDYRIEFDPDQRKKYAYRVEPRSKKARNVTTLDDNNTQAALRFMMALDKTLGFNDEQIHEAVEFALAALLKAQYPNGAWPQRFSAFPSPQDHPVLKATYPPTWPRSHPKHDYRNYYTFNDNAIADMIDVMFIAGRTYNNDQYRQSAERAGNFILMAQMPEPQPAWAQQYNLKMQPAWARRFEPASITGGESQGVMRILLRLYRNTGNKKYLEPIPKAIAYLRKSELPDGRLARFYELETNRPLYFTKKYKLTYDDNDLPTHYAFKIGNKLDQIQRNFDHLSNLPQEKLGPIVEAKPNLTRQLENQTRSVIAALDKRGCWVEDGRLKSIESDADVQIISCATFIKNTSILCKYLQASR